MAKKKNDVIKDVAPNPNPTQPKKSVISKVLVFLLIVLVILAICGIGVYVYLQNKNKPTTKDLFVSYLGKTDLETFLNAEKINSFSKRLQSEDSEATTTITGSETGLFSSSESSLDLSDIEIETESKKSPELGKAFSRVLVNYKDNELINFDLLSSGNRIGVNSKEIVIKYIGSKYSGLSRVLSKFLSKEENNVNLDFDFSALQNIDFKPFEISNDIFAKYVDVIKQKIDKANFTSKEITLDRASGKIDVTEFSMNLKESQMIELLDQMLQTLENDDELLDKVFSVIKDEEDRNSLKEQAKTQIETLIGKLYENTPDDTRNYSLKVYGSKDVVYKLIFDINGKNSVDIDFDYQENAKNMTITYLQTESQSGYSIEFEKKMSSVSEKLNVTFNVIQNSEIVGKVEANMDLEVSGNSYTVKNKLGVNFNIIGFNLQTNSEVNFKTVNIDDLTNDNCIYLDEQNEDTLNDLVKAIKEKTIEVMSENLVEQGHEPLVENSDDEENQEQTPLTEEQLREQAKNKVAESIINAMNVAQSEGREYTLNDLINLDVPGSTFTVSINGEEAILNVDGFEFRLDSNFQLYD